MVAMAGYVCQTTYGKSNSIQPIHPLCCITVCCVLIGWLGLVGCYLSLSVCVCVCPSLCPVHHSLHLQAIVFVDFNAAAAAKFDVI